MMTVALLLALAPQDDPAAAYREGLYEEIDQGNLDRAVTLYAKVLKSDGDAALKAKALFRTGHCHEKGGRRKEAEQTYRDVIDRYPAIEDTVRLARARLAAMNGKETGGVPLEAQIGQLILDLGSNNATTRAAAIRRLTLLGGVAVPDLKRAIQHKDAILSAGAAQVLVDQEHYDGLYDTFVRALERGGMIDTDHHAFSRLLSARDDDRKRFVADVPRLSPYRLSIVVKRMTTHDAGLQDALAKRIVDERSQTDTTQLLEAWAPNADTPQLAAMIEKLARHPARLAHVLRHLAPYALKDTFNRGVISPLLRKSLEGADGPARGSDSLEFLPSGYDWQNAESDLIGSHAAVYLRLLVWLPEFMTPKDALALLATWLKSDLPDARRAMMRIVRKRFGGYRAFRPVSGYVEFLFDALGTPAYADDVRNDALDFVSGLTPTAEQRVRLTTYYSSYLALHKDAEADDDIVRSGIRHLARTLPADAKELDAVFDRAFDRSMELDVREATRPRYLAAAVRALRSADEGVRDNASTRLTDEKNGEDRLNAPAWLKDVTDLDVASRLLDAFTDAMEDAIPARRDKAIADLQGVLGSATQVVRKGLFARLKGRFEPGLRETMKAALTDADAEIRLCAIEHWTIMKDESAASLLVQALKDASERNRMAAIQALGDMPSLDSVPPLIEMLRAPGADVRSEARAALEKIRKHVDEQEEWRKWYDEVKKKK